MEFNIWLDNVITSGNFDSIIAFNFNLYESEEECHYDVQLVGAQSYDLLNPDWACNVQYSSEENLFSFLANDWEDALVIAIELVKKYLTQCNRTNPLSRAEYITVGFVDGDLEIIKQNEKKIRFT